MVTKKLVEFDVAKLVGLSFNPPRRTKDERMTPLMKSLKEIGIIQPITITADGTILDGHRRATAAKKLKWKTISAIVIAGVEANKVYRDVNSTSAKMNGNDNLGIYLRDKSALTPNIVKQIGNIESVIGLQSLRELYAKGLSIRVYRIAKKITELCDCETPTQIKKVMKWLVDHGMIGRVMKAIEGGQNPDVILKAVKRNKPIEMKLGLVG